MDTRISRRRALAMLLFVDRYQRRDRLWVHPINRRRREQGAFYHLVAELRMDEQRFHMYFRMSPQQMEDILCVIGPEIIRQSTNYRATIEPKQRLAVALRFMATGDSFISLAFSYRLGHATVSNSVHMVCQAIEKKMLATHIPAPTEEKWAAISQGFWQRWNFPNCLGAIDGKHVAIRAPPRSGSQYFNYKKTFSIVLLALVDAEYRFTAIQVGDFGRASDGGVYATSKLGRGMESGTLNVPSAAALPGAAHLGDMPFAIVGDAAFPLKPYLMRPYPGHNLTKQKRIFNYRLSRARNVVENSFGILSSRWRVFLRTIHLNPDNVDCLVIACCILHNYLSAPRDNQRVLEEGEQQGGRMLPVRNMGGNRASREACRVREVFTGYFSSPEGSVSWQDRMV